MPKYLWESDWLECDQEFKRHMIFTMTRMQKPIYMTVGRFAPLTLQTFGAVRIKLFDVID